MAALYKIVRNSLVSKNMIIVNDNTGTKAYLKACYTLCGKKVTAISAHCNKEKYERSVCFW